MTKVTNSGRKPAKNSRTKAAPKKPPPAKRKAKTKKVKPKKVKQPPRIAPSTYNAMYQAYKERQSVAHVARAAGVSYDTATHYVTGPGAPDFAMEPIRARFLRAERSRQQEEDMTAAKAAKMRIKLVDAILNLAEGEGVLLQDDLKARVDDYRARLEEWKKGSPATRGEPPRAPVKLGLGSLGKLVDRMVRTEQFLRGGYDSKIGVADATGRFANYTDEELLQHALTGRVPDHDRSANNAGNGDR